MSADTYTAIPRAAIPPRLFCIEEAIRTYIRNNMTKSFAAPISERLMDDLAARQAREITEELLDRHLIGLPVGSAARTSVDCDLIAQLGAKLLCRKGDDADDVVRTAVTVGMVVG